MWKKNEDQPNTPETKSVEPRPSVEARREPPKTTLEPARAAGPRSAGSNSVIGSSITITGAIKGTEDLLVQGVVEGEISLPKNTIVIGAEGKVEASIEAKAIRVEGEVIGDMTGLEQVVVANAGIVRGNITSPRVILEDGAKLKGSIDMDSLSDEKSNRSPEQRTNSTKAAESSEVDKKIVAPVVPNSSH